MFIRWCFPWNDSNAVCTSRDWFTSSCSAQCCRVKQFVIFNIFLLFPVTAGLLSAWVSGRPTWSSAKRNWSQSESVRFSPCTAFNKMKRQRRLHVLDVITARSVLARLPLIHHLWSCVHNQVWHPVTAEDVQLLPRREKLPAEDAWGKTRLSRRHVTWQKPNEKKTNRVIDLLLCWLCGRAGLHCKTVHMYDWNQLNWQFYSQVVSVKRKNLRPNK